MKSICFAALLLVLLSFCDASDDPKCIEGQTITHDCNNCVCTQAGVYACTLMACYHEESYPDTLVETTSASSQICTPNDTKTEDCNRCRCSSDGRLWACTRKACPSKVKIPVNEPGFTCTPNKPFKDDCNSCTCDASGTLARCTAMACDPNERYKRDVVTTIATTIPSGIKKGKLDVTTQQTATPVVSGIAQSNPTLSTSTVSAVKKPQTIGESKPVSNVPTPTIPTKTGIETRGDSPKAANDNVPLPSRMIPVVSTTTNKYISSGTAERFVTQEELKDPKFTCTPSLSFKVDCNTCWCAANGKEPRFCTRIACKPKTYPPLDKQ